MNEMNSYCIQCTTDKAYDSLAMYILDLRVRATLVPEHMAVIVEPESEEMLDEIKLGCKQLIPFNEARICPIILHNESRNDIVDSELVDAATLRKLIYTMFEERKLMVDKHEEVTADLTEQLLKCKSEVEHMRDTHEWSIKALSSGKEKFSRLQASFKTLQAMIEVTNRIASETCESFEAD